MLLPTIPAAPRTGYTSPQCGHSPRPEGPARGCVLGGTGITMATIIISGPIQICEEPSGEELTDLAKLKRFDGAEEKGANLAEYLDGELAHLGLARGDLKLKYDAKGKRVLVESTFEAPKKLSPKQLKALVEYTRGQWSDGAGEGAFDKLMDKHSVGMDLTPFGSEAQNPRPADRPRGPEAQAHARARCRSREGEHRQGPKASQERCRHQQPRQAPPNGIARRAFTRSLRPGPPVDGPRRRRQRR